MARDLKIISIVNNQPDILTKVKASVKYMGGPENFIRDEFVTNPKDMHPERIIYLEGNSAHLSRIIDGLSMYGAKELTADEALALAEIIDPPMVKITARYECTEGAWSKVVDQLGFTVLKKDRVMKMRKTKTQWIVEAYGTANWNQLSIYEKSLFASEELFVQNCKIFWAEKRNWSELTAGAKALFNNDEAEYVAFIKLLILSGEKDWEVLSELDKEYFADQEEYESLLSEI